MTIEVVEIVSGVEQGEWKTVHSKQVNISLIKIRFANKISF